MASVSVKVLLLKSESKIVAGNESVAVLLKMPVASIFKLPLTVMITP